jgi:hypothetical protein
MSAPKFDTTGTAATAWGRIAIDDVHTKFPANTADPAWWNAKEFSYHQYNSPGYGMRSAWDNVQNALSRNANGATMEARITGRCSCAPQRCFHA